MTVPYRTVGEVLANHRALLGRASPHYGRCVGPHLRQYGRGRANGETVIHARRFHRAWRDGQRHGGASRQGRPYARAVRSRARHHPPDRAPAQGRARCQVAARGGGSLRRGVHDAAQRACCARLHLRQRRPRRRLQGRRHPGRHLLRRAVDHVRECAQPLRPRRHHDRRAGYPGPSKARRAPPLSSCAAARSVHWLACARCSS
jgi:hypothetical protein